MFFFFGADERRIPARQFTAVAQAMMFFRLDSGGLADVAIVSDGNFDYRFARLRIAALVRDNRMHDDKPGRSTGALAEVGNFFKDLGKSIIKGLVQYVIAFAVGTGAGALVCLYYGVPLVFSLIGGFIVLGLALALMSDSIFS